MSWASDEMLAERRLRSSELALETTRRRLVEANDEIGRLHARVVELEKALESALKVEPALLAKELAAERSRRVELAQILQDERGRRFELEDELELSRAPWSMTAERELADAQRRARELEGELEVVRRHSAEFEQAIRLAVEEAWGWMGEIADRLMLALRQQGELAPQSASEGGDEVASVALELRQQAVSVRDQAASSVAPALRRPPAATVDLDRLDQARSRLREDPGLEFTPPAAASRRGLIQRLRRR